jgi:hypothetical protein
MAKKANHGKHSSLFVKGWSQPKWNTFKVFHCVDGRLHTLPTINRLAIYKHSSLFASDEGLKRFITLTTGSDGRRHLATDVPPPLSSRPPSEVPASLSMSSLQRKRPLLRSKAKTHSDSLTTKTRSSTSKSVESTLKRKPSRYFAEATFFYDDVPPLDDLSSERLTPPILSEWIRAKGENFGSVYLVYVLTYVFIPVSIHEHRTHTHTLSLSLTHTHTYTSACVWVCVCVCVWVCVYGCVCMGVCMVCVCVCVCIHGNTQRRALSLSLSLSHTQTHTRIHKIVSVCLCV